MKKLHLLQLQATVLVLLAFATTTKGGATELYNWMISAKAVQTSGKVTTSYKTGDSSVSNVVEVVQIGTVKAAKANESDILVAYDSGNRPPFPGLDSRITSTTNFLPWFDDKASFLLLNHKDYGNWFFTPKLSGCDVWIADSEGVEPIVVHINANSYVGKSKVENLTYKQTLALEALNVFNGKYKHDYQYIQRVSYDYASDYPNEKEDIDEYWNKFTNDFKIPHTTYRIVEGYNFFFGLYAESTWTFALKDLASGTIQHQISCSEVKNRCSVM